VPRASAPEIASRHAAEWLEYFEVMHAVGRIQATMVPINFHFRREEIGYILEDSGAKLIVAHADHLGEAKPALGSRAALVVGEAPGLRSYERELANASPELPPDAILRHGFNVMIYTSGRPAIRKASSIRRWTRRSASNPRT